MFRNHRLLASAALTFLLLSVTLLYLFPLLREGLTPSSILALLLNNAHDFGSTIIRTVVFASVTTFIMTMMGFTCALMLARVSISSFVGRQLSWFLLPVMLGSVSSAFVFKICLFDTPFFNAIVESSNYSKLILLGALQIWQFFFFFTYLFWMNLRTLDSSKLQYGRAVGMNYWEGLRDIIIPASRNLGVLLLLFGFVFAFYEDAMNQFIFRASQGTHTELISHWLRREYQSNLLVAPQFANSKALGNSLTVMGVAIICFLSLGLISNFAIKRFCRIKSQVCISTARLNTGPTSRGTTIGIVFGILCLCVVFLPLLSVYAKIGFNRLTGLVELVLPFALSLGAALLAAIVSVSIAALSRALFRRSLQDFNSRSLLVMASVFLLMTVPSLAVLLSGFQWLAWLGYNSAILIYLVWVTSHAVLLSPLLITFLISVHFGVHRGELEYLSAYSLRFREIALYSFIRRFALEYLLLLVIAVSFIWNEAVMNVVLSDRIPSFAARMQMMFIGRAADYESASSYLAVSISLAVVGIIIWAIILKRKASTREII